MFTKFYPDAQARYYFAAQECADSRFFAGIHFKSDNEVGLVLGKKVGEYIIETWDKR